MRARLRWLPLAGALLLGAALAGCGSAKSGGGSSTSATASSHVSRPKLDATGELEPPRKAPEIDLRNWNGQRVRLAQYRGRAVMITFIYDHCPDTCPLIVDHLRQALVELGPRADKLQVIAVSVDPRGDTPKTVRKFLVEHRMLGRMDYLIGSREELAPVWKAYDVASEASPEQREVSHTALVYGITGKGVQLALYDSAFKGAEVAHDAPLLAAL